jgi:hypothetical protein
MQWTSTGRVAWRLGASGIEVFVAGAPYDTSAALSEWAVVVRKT